MRQLFECENSSSYLTFTDKEKQSRVGMCAGMAAAWASRAVLIGAPSKYSDLDIRKATFASAAHFVAPGFGLSSVVDVFNVKAQMELSLVENTPEALFDMLRDWEGVYIFTVETGTASAHAMGWRNTGAPEGIFQFFDPNFGLFELTNEEMNANSIEFILHLINHYHGFSKFSMQQITA